MRSSRNIKSVTFSGLAMSLIVVMLFMASIVDVLDYTISALCGLVITFVLIEFGTSSAVCTYIGSSILGLLLVPNKLNAILFIAFCGWYPFVKRFFEGTRRLLCVILKFAVFNVALTAIIFITKAVLFIKIDSFMMYAALYLVSNFTFLMYDILITKVIFLYIHKYRSKMKFFK